MEITSKSYLSEQQDGNNAGQANAYGAPAPAAGGYAPAPAAGSYGAPAPAQGGYSYAAPPAPAANTYGAPAGQPVNYGGQNPNAGAPAPSYQGYSQPAAPQFAVLEDDDAQLPF